MSGVVFVCTDTVRAERHVSSWLPPFNMADKVERNPFIKDQLAEFAAKYPYKPDTDANMNLDVVPTDAQPAVEILRLFHDDKLAPDEAVAVLIGEANGNSKGISSVPASVVIDTKYVALSNGIKDPWLAEAYLQYNEHGYAPGEKLHRKWKRTKSPPPTPTAQRGSGSTIFFQASTIRDLKMTKKIHFVVTSWIS